MSLTGTMKSVDILGFQSSLKDMLECWEYISETATALWTQEDNRFEYCFTLMDMLGTTPKIGLDTGFKPTIPKHAGSEIKGRNKIDRVLEPEEHCIGGDDTRSEHDRVANFIEFDDVCFKYPGLQKRMMNNVTCQIKKGSFVGICGARGAGKTTLFKLLLRLYDPEQGSIRIGGRDVKDYHPVWLRSQIGLSKQDPAMFTDYGKLKSLRANMMYGSEVTLKELGSGQQVDQHLLSILALLQQKDHFTGPKYPQGLDTPLAHGRLSGGEIRTIANVRAMVASPPILLLDEFTAGLDAESEAHAIKALTADRLVFVHIPCSPVPR